MNLLEEGSNWLADQMAEHASSEIVYRRGSQSVHLQASFAKTEFKAVDVSGMIVPVTSHDWTFKASLLAFAPAEGDCIEATFQGVRTEFEVYSFGQNNGVPFRTCDPYGHQLRVHTRKGKVLS